MGKIASPQDLATALRSLLASCQDGVNREKLASQLNALADRVAGFSEGKANSSGTYTVLIPGLKKEVEVKPSQLDSR